jgi:hypothetical protein
MTVFNSAEFLRRTWGCGMRWLIVGQCVHGYYVCWLLATFVDYLLRHLSVGQVDCQRLSLLQIR